MEKNLSRNVRWAEQQVAKIRVKRDVYLQPPPNDPSWPRMWYLVSSPLLIKNRVFLYVHISLNLS
ncbi:hypothetical protein ACTXT7_010457 [Hymenolepis weldensis]